MLDPKLKAILLVSVLVVAIGVPVIIYASTVKPVENMMPVAKITAPATGYVNTPLPFSAAKSTDSDGYISLYVWNFGDGSSSAGKYVNHTYLAVGNYTVTLTVYDNAGGSSSTKVKVEIKKQEEKSPVTGVNDLLTNTSAYIGREVKVRGVFAYGSNYSFYMVNVSGYRGIRVYAEPGASRPEKIEYGDYLEVFGRFTVYKNELEVKVENNSRHYIIILSHNTTTSYENITSGSWMNYNNSLVILRSEVTEVYAPYKYNIGNLTVYVSYGATQFGSPAIHDIFEVRGFLTYYHSTKYGYGYPEIYVRNSTDDYSKYVSSTYANVSIDHVLNNTLNYNNTAVHIEEAVVVDDYASWNFDVGYPNRSIRVYVEKGGVVDGMVFKGARVEIWATVAYYHGVWELKVRNATTDMIVVKSRPTYQDVPVETLVKNPETYNGSNVHSWGVISWTYSNESSGLRLFGLFHNGSEITVVGFNGSNMSGVVSGRYADVYGEFTNYHGSWEIKIRPESYDFVVTRPQNYTNVNITQVLNNASNYNNTLLHVEYAVVTSVYNASWLFWVSNTSNNTQEISVYVEKGASIDSVYVGARVEIWAQLTWYHGEWEFKVRNGTNDTVKLLTQTTYMDVNITDILNNASAYNNTNVHIPNATVVGVKYTYLFWVSNSTDNTKDIAVFAGGVSVPTVGKGDTVELYGVVAYHNGSYEIKIRPNTPDRVILLHSTARYVNFTYIHEVDSNGTLVHEGQQVIVNGTVIVPPKVYSYNTSSGPVLKFYIEGVDGGVQIFGFLNYSKLNLTEGDYISVRGTITQYNGEAEVKVSDLRYIKYINHTDPLTPEEVSTGIFSNWSNAERIEGTLVKIEGTVTDKYVGSTFVKITVDDGSGGVVVFIRNSWGINTTNISKGDNISVIGIVSQYDSSSPYTESYEILPRYQSDISKINKSVGKSETSSPSTIIELEVIAWRRNIALIVGDTLVH